MFKEVTSNRHYKTARKDVPLEIERRQAEPSEAIKSYSVSLLFLCDILRALTVLLLESTFSHPAIDYKYN